MKTWLMCASLLIAGLNLSCNRTVVCTPAKILPERHELTPVYFLNDVCNGIATSPNGRAFVCFPKPDGGGGIRIGEMTTDHTVTAYPDLHWNDWKIGEDPTHQFVRANSLRFGPDGKLWIVDTGTAAQDTPVITGGPKLVAIDVASNSVSRIIPLDGLCKPKSFIDDVRFNGPNIYITDAGEPALIVMDYASGKGRRVLENDQSTTGSRDMYASGKLMVKTSGEHLKMHADQLEVSPDARTLYFMPPTGPMWAIETKFLNDPNLTDLGSHVRKFFDAPTTGGTCIDADGNVYDDDCQHQRVLKISPDGNPSVVIQDKRLEWGDALWIDNRGNLWIPAAQLNRSAGLNSGVSKVQYPVTIYRLFIGAKNVLN